MLFAIFKYIGLSCSDLDVSAIDVTCHLTDPFTHEPLYVLEQHTLDTFSARIGSLQCLIWHFKAAGTRQQQDCRRLLERTCAPAHHLE